MHKAIRIVIPVALVAAALAGLGLWWFFSGDAPAEVSLEAATESVLEDEVDAGSIDGTWTVDTETGEFGYESATGSFVGFRIEEELQSIGSTTAVGRTGDVTGIVEIADGALIAAEFEIDVTTITTNDSRRDDNVQDALDVGSFPTATFVLTEPIDLPDGAVGGEAIAVATIGQLTIHGVAQAVEFDLEAQLVGDTVVIVGSTDIVFADYDVEIPASGIIVSVDDFGVLELQLLLVQG